MMSTILTFEGQRLTQSAHVVQVYMFSTTESSAGISPLSRPYERTIRPLESAESQPIALNEGQTLLQNPHIVQTLTAFLISSILSVSNVIP